uniref:Uncharacterized protein n=1 Tax=Salarias fasciatus TaxID=181472 RepID=A0A672H4E1_SALFA
MTIAPPPEALYSPPLPEIILYLVGLNVKENSCYVTGTRIIYDRRFLLERRNSPIAQTPPAHLPVIPGVTSQHVLSENQKNEANNHINNHDGKPATAATTTVSVRPKSEMAKTSHAKARLTPESESPPVSDANEALLASIKVMMDEMRTDIISRFESVISATIKRELSTALEPLKAKPVADLELLSNDHANQLANLQRKAAMLTTQVEALTRKCEDLEERCRWSNVRLVGFPEGTEGRHPTESHPAPCQ